jgi:hypothetical protein
VIAVLYIYYSYLLLARKEYIPYSTGGGGVSSCCWRVCVCVCWCGGAAGLSARLHRRVVVESVSCTQVPFSVVLVLVLVVLLSFGSLANPLF